MKVRNKYIMKKFKREKRNIYLYFIAMLVIFVAVELLCQILPSLLLYNIKSNKYGSELLLEMLFAFVVLIVMLFFKNSYVFTEKKMKFVDSVLLGLPMLIVILINIYFNYSSLETINYPNLINLLLYCTFIGIGEEFLCRGFLQNEFIERFGDSKKHILLSILFSSLIFGLMHISNVLTGQSLFETIMQVLQATSIGILFGSIYYKSKNIWSVIFLHGIYDFSIMLSDINVIKSCDYAYTSKSIIIYSLFVSLVIILYYVFNALYVLNSTDLKDRKEFLNKRFIVNGIISLFILMYLPIGIFVNDDGYQTCYEYETKVIDDSYYEKHYPFYDEYDITINKENNFLGISESYIYNFSIKDNDFIISNKNTKKDIKIHYDNLSNFVILKNDKNYIIIVTIDDGYSSNIYYSNFINEDNASNDELYLNDIKDSFIKYDLPSLVGNGYLTFKNDEYKYPYFIGSGNNHFMIDKNNKLYLIKSE